MTWTPYPAATKQGRAPASLQMVRGWVFLQPKHKPKPKIKHKHKPLISPDHTPVPLCRVPEAGASVPKSVRPTEPWFAANGLAVAAFFGACCHRGYSPASSFPRAVKSALCPKEEH
ncbi:predicted protein [Histoplasma capsulatum var. duboisii H88]|uniref:Predicted protein n=1 Tax=Ajellomyces capsulatus (strain H88) TaxID=544711 RepID=F0UNH7_AJEC8|nr:predicted protein [Histoplasma capsulatum var. duboisii H88]